MVSELIEINHDVDEQSSSTKGVIVVRMYLTLMVREAACAR